MTLAEQFASRLDGCTDVSKEIAAEAKAAGLVIVYGASDDLIEFDGAIYDEVGAFDGGVVYLAKGEVLQECEEPCDHCQIDELKKEAKRIHGVWGGDTYDWEMIADDGIVAFPFDMVDTDNEDEDHYYCKGLVFEVSQVS